MKGKIPDNIRIMHIIENIEKIEKSLKGKSFDDFFDDDVLRSAIVRWLEVIGEAARYISEETKNNYREIEWRKMTGLRNIVIHRYFDVDYIAIWKAAIFLIDLRSKIETIKVDLGTPKD